MIRYRITKLVSLFRQRIGIRIEGCLQIKRIDWVVMTFKDYIRNNKFCLSVSRLFQPRDRVLYSCFTKIHFNEQYKTCHLMTRIKTTS